MITAKIVWSIVLFGITFVLPPNEHLLYAVFTMIAMDFLTGVAKAKMSGKARTSEGYRRTIVKFLQYFISIILPLAASRLLPDIAVILKQTAGYVMLFIIYIEVTSVFENLYEIDKNKSPFSKYLVKPVLMILKFGIEHNPVISAAERITHEETTKTVTHEKTTIENPTINESAKI